ncbi:hypothetical protein [Streptomyces sp. NPDC004042]|uniref:hypothetical protein n=1 Tax=Streptomyces sp. NPDC004042 TaxID=3154451 RepID=UPI0033A4B877
MSDRRPIIPTRIIPAGAPLPAPAGPPPPPPRPPAPPSVADPGPDWWHNGSGPYGPPPIHVHHHHVYVDLPPIYLPGHPDPEPVPRWWQRIRIAYNAGLAFLATPLSGPWAWVLIHVRDDGSLTGAWVMALIPLAVLGLWDNVRRAEAAGAHPDLWPPKLRAGLARLLLWAAVIGTVLALPITTLVYLITGVTA